jgi:NitT/TauT family transport system substrate-binding protein
MQRRTLLKSSALFAFGAAIPATLTACNQQPSNQTAAPTSQGTTPLVLGISGWPGWGAHYIALAKGFFKETGLNLDVKTFSSFTELNTAFLAGKLDMMYMGGADLIVLSQQIPGIRGIMVSDYSYGADGLVGRGEINSIADLKGKKIAVEDTPYNAVMMHHMLKKGGLTEKDVEILGMATDAAATAVITGQVDGALIYQPFLDKAAKEGKCNILTTTKDTNICPNMLATTTKVLTERKADVTAYIKAYGKAMELYRSNLSEMVPFVAKEVGAKPEEVIEQLKGIRTFSLKEHLEVPFNLSQDLNIYKSFVDMNEVLTMRGRLSSKVDTKALLDESVLRAAIA